MFTDHYILLGLQHVSAMHLLWLVALEPFKEQFDCQ